MATPKLNDSQFYPTKEELKDIYLRSLKLSARNRAGLTVNTLPNSEAEFRAEALASMAAPAFANNKLARAEESPLSATGDKLEELANQFGVYRREAAPSSGYVLVKTFPKAGGGFFTVTIPSGYKLQAPSGEQFETVAAATVTNGGAVQVRALSSGEATNQDPSTPMTWTATSVGQLASTCTVDASGLTGGTDVDGDQVLRNRLLERLSNPAVGGNWSQVKAWAEDSSGSIGAAFVYPAARGPGSVDVALAAATGDRTVTSLVINKAAQAIVGNLPGHVDVNVTTVDEVGIDLLLKASLPLPVVAGGAGGGWLDATPWPNATSGDVKVTALASDQITTDATALNGVAIGSHIAIWESATETMHTYEVSNAVVDAGFVKLKVFGGFSFDPTGHYISAGMARATDYASALLLAMQGLGPGQKTDDAQLLPRAYRRPQPDAGYPTDVGSKVLAEVTNDYPEFLSLDYSQRYATGTTTTTTEPGLPATTSAAPKILTLTYFAIRQA